MLEVVCVGDRIAANGGDPPHPVHDGRGQVRVDARAPYVVAARAGAPDLAGNAYRAVNEQVMPDMKRLPWDVRLKGGEVAFAFALPQLTGRGPGDSSGAARPAGPCHRRRGALLAPP